MAKTDDFIFQDRKGLINYNNEQVMKHISIMCNIYEENEMLNNLILHAGPFVEPVVKFISLLEELLYQVRRHDQHSLLSLLHHTFRKWSDRFGYDPVCVERIENITHDGKETNIFTETNYITNNAIYSRSEHTKLTHRCLEWRPETEANSQKKNKAMNRQAEEIQKTNHGKGNVSSKKQLSDMVQSKNGLLTAAKKKPEQSQDSIASTQDEVRKSNSNDFMGKKETLSIQGCEDDTFAKHTPLGKENKDIGETCESNKAHNKGGTTKPDRQKIVKRFGIQVVLPEGLSVTSKLKPKERKQLKRIYNEFLEKVQDDLPDYIIDTYMSKKAKKIHIGYKPGTEKESRLYIQSICDQNEDMFEFEPREPPQYLSSKLKHCFQNTGNPFDCDK